MSQAKHVYRNVENGREGVLTEDQARIWPDLLVRVDDTAEPPAPEEAPTPVGILSVGASEAQSPARTKKKD